MNLTQEEIDEIWIGARAYKAGLLANRTTTDAEKKVIQVQFENKLIELASAKTQEKIFEKIDKIILDDKAEIVSLFQNMKAISQNVVIGEKELIEGETGHITIKNSKDVTPHDEQHICEICVLKRKIYDLEKLKGDSK